MRSRILQSLCAVFAVFAVTLFSLPAQATASNFRFLSTSVPNGTTNAEYYSKLLVANAAGPVSFSVAPASADPMPAGLALNELTGAITGYPTTVQTNDVTIAATDGTTIITLRISKFKISAAGGGGNSGASFATTTLPTGRIGVAYTVTLSPSGGVGPFIYGAQNLPTGVSLDGTTGVVSGTPQVAGTFFVTFSLNDEGEGNRVLTTLPMTIYPASVDLTYNFKFETYMLNNGQVGTAYTDTYLTSDAEGVVTYSATGLPDGLVLDQATGIVSGAPTAGGTYYVNLSAYDDGTQISISTNLVMWVATSSTSNFFWNFFGVPAALYGMPYDRQPPIVIDTINGSSVTYSASGMPPGMLYNTSTGELTGTPSEVGIYPVLFTAVSAGTAETITMSIDMVVLPPKGGDVGRLAVNLWTKKLQVKVNVDPVTAPNDSWSAQYIYNADRRTGKIFNPATDALVFQLGSSKVTIPAGAMVASATSGQFSYRSATGQIPKISVRGTPSSQTLQVTVAGTELGTTLPVDPIDGITILGPKGFKQKLQLDIKGKFTPTFAYRTAVMVVEKGTLAQTGSTRDSLKFKLDFADPSFQFPVGTPISLKLYTGTTVLLDKDLTNLVTVTQTIDRAGHTVYALKKSVTDPAVQNVLKNLKFSSSKGQLSIDLAVLSLAANLASLQAPVGVELTVGTMSYFTTVTMFETKIGSKSYTTSITRDALPF